MENVTQEQFLALGAVGIAILGAAALACLAIMAGTLKLSISWIGNRTPSFLSCCGWLLAISFVNCLLVYGTLILFNQTALLLVTPLTWFVTLYMLATAADCGMFRALGVWISHSILSTIGIVALIFVCAIPLAFIGGGLENASSNFGMDFNDVDAAWADNNSQGEPLDQTRLADENNVGIREVQFRDPRNQNEGANELPVSRASVPPSASRTSVQPKRQTRRASDSKPRKARRAADGSMVNPYFQD